MKALVRKIVDSWPKLLASQVDLPLTAQNFLMVRTTIFSHIRTTETEFARVWASSQIRSCSGCLYCGNHLDDLGQRMARILFNTEMMSKVNAQTVEKNLTDRGISYEKFFKKSLSAKELKLLQGGRLTIGMFISRHPMDFIGSILNAKSTC